MHLFVRDVLNTAPDKLHWRGTVQNVCGELCLVYIEGPEGKSRETPEERQLSVIHVQ